VYLSECGFCACVCVCVMCVMCVCVCVCMCVIVVCVCVCVCVCAPMLSLIPLLVTPWTVAHWAPLSSVHAGEK